MRGQLGEGGTEECWDFVWFYGRVVLSKLPCRSCTVTKSEIQFLVFIAYDEQFLILLPKELCGKGITREFFSGQLCV